MERKPWITANEFISCLSQSDHLFDEWMDKSRPTKGPIYRAFTKSKYSLGKSLRSEVLMCVDLSMKPKRAAHHIDMLFRNIAGFAIAEGKPFRVRVLIDNLIVDGKLVDNCRRNKFMVILHSKP